MMARFEDRSLGNDRPSMDPAPTRDGPRRHRIATVRQQQGISLRSAARQMGSDMAQVRQQESEQSDLRISDLVRWQQVLDVPLVELLVDPGPTLSAPVMDRARMLRIMKTAVTIRERANTPGLQRLAQMLVEQLLEIMPELAEVSPWHTVGRRRSLDEYGRIVERCMNEDVLHYRSRND